MKKWLTVLLLVTMITFAAAAWELQGRWTAEGDWNTIVTLQENVNKKSAIFKADGDYLAFKITDGTTWYGENQVNTGTYNETYDYWWGNLGSSEPDAVISSGLINGDYYLIVWNGDNSNFWTLEHIKEMKCTVKKDVEGTPVEETINLVQSASEKANWYKNTAFNVSTAGQKWQFKFLINGFENSNFNQGGGFRVAIIDYWEHSSPGYIANDQDHWIEWSNIPIGSYNIAVQVSTYQYEIQTTDLELPISLSDFSAAALNGCVSVTWVTESESENAHFLLYRDGEVIAQIPAAGTSTEPHSYAYTDRYVVPGRTYTYQLADVSFDGEEMKHNELEVEVEAEYVDQVYTIGAAYPNPFNPLTVVPLNLAKEAVVTATLYDISGRPLRELLNGTLSAGSHAITVDGVGLSTGIYFVHVRVNDATHVQKIALMK